MTQGVPLFDVRPLAHYREAHIPGAVHVPYQMNSPKEVEYDDSVDAFDLTKLPRDKNAPMIFQCNGAECWYSYKAARYMVQRGYTKIYWFRTGLPAWKAAGYPVRSAAPEHCQGGSVDNPNDLAGTKVMVIDDSNTIRRSAEIFLLQTGCEVILAEDGFDALAKITDHQPQVIFVDIMMPRLDGYQTCALIKKNPQAARHAGDHAVQQGRPVRPGARTPGGFGRIPHQALHQGHPAGGGAPSSAEGWLMTAKGAPCPSRES
jgi:CheY-like chemotaxis protein/rhodanese-related sulfurtransferase